MPRRKPKRVLDFRPGVLYLASMNFLFTDDGLRIGRDRDDKPVRKESTVVHRIITALNAGETRGRWTRFHPYRHGLTSCRIGLRNAKRGIVYWHERYQVEDAAKEFNAGQLFLQKSS